MDTVRIFVNRGFVPSLEEVRGFLIGGPVPGDGLESYIATCGDLFLEDGLVCPTGQDALVSKSILRRKSNDHASEKYLEIAKEFAAELASYCPFVRTIALCGSLATGGFSEEDDVDLNIITEDDSRYITYLMANLLGLRYSLQLRDKPRDSLHNMPILPKVICLNVVIEEGWAVPFERQDEQMAFELLLSRPLYGVTYFRELLKVNSWLNSYFPQIYETKHEEEIAHSRSLLGSLLRLFCRPRKARRALDALCKALSWIFYSYVHWSRRNDPEAMARIEFIKRVKEPYEVFQEGRSSLRH